MGLAGNGGGARAGIRALDRSLESRAQELEQVIAIASTPPTVNQVQFSPIDTGGRCSRHAGLAPWPSRHTARSGPVGTSPIRPSQALPIAWAEPAQVLLRLCIQRETIVLPRSTHQERIEADAQIFDFSLSEDDMATLDALDTPAAPTRLASASGGDRSPEADRGRPEGPLALKEELCTGRK